MKFKAEQQRRLEDGEKKQKVIEELEKDIEITLQSQIQENEKLKALTQTQSSGMRMFDQFRQDLEKLYTDRNVELSRSPKRIGGDPQPMDLQKVLDKAM